MKRWLSALAACAIAGALVSGCSKSADQSPTSAVSGPVTDEADSGLKPVEMAPGAMGDPIHGKKVFDTNCASCHGAGGVGGGIGPVLKGEKARKDNAATIAWIKNPQMPMPKLFPATLKENDVDDVAAYVQSL